MDTGQDKHKVRFFDWRDFRLVQRLQGQGQVLEYERARVDGVFPLQDALRNYLLLGTGRCRTIVMTGTEAFAQYGFSRGSDRALLTFLSPAPTSAEYAERWVKLLDRLVAAVGAQGVHHIGAEASVDGPEMELLQCAGFGVYARQELFCLSSPPRPDADLSPLAGLRPWQSTDDWGLRLLYANTVPQLAQQIGSPEDNALISPRWQHRLVLEREGEIIAGLAIRRGRVGSALRLLLHPQADVYVEALIRHGLAKLASGSPQPVYCRVRRYESWLRLPLEASGFEPEARTLLLVKHTVARVMSPEWNRVLAMEGRAEMTTPLAQARIRKSPES